nr:hypothetical protein asmbl_19 [uncultured bacterium]
MDLSAAPVPDLLAVETRRHAGVSLRAGAIGLSLRVRDRHHRSRAPQDAPRATRRRLLYWLSARP